MFIHGIHYQMFKGTEILSLLHLPVQVLVPVLRLLLDPQADWLRFSFRQPDRNGSGGTLTRIIT